MSKNIKTSPTPTTSTNVNVDPPPPTQISKYISSIEILESQLSRLELMDKTQKQRMKLFQFQKQKLGKLSDDDFESLCELGAGNGGVGSVEKVLYKAGEVIMARKRIRLEVKLGKKKEIVEDLKILDNCSSPFIVGYYGAFPTNEGISICMEYMNGGSLDPVLKRYGKIPENILGRITSAVLQGLAYLGEQHHIIHRDVKPSNILVNTCGEIKICDFEVSGHLINTMNNSLVGTRSYMSPERIQGTQHHFMESDIWSLGLSLEEMALGHYPIPPPNYSQSGEKTQSGGTLFEILNYIVYEPPPKLPEGQFTKEFQDFVNRCLQKDPNGRADLNALMSHPWVRQWENQNVDIADWVQKAIKSPTCSKIKSCRCKQLTTIWEEDEFVPPFPPTDKPGFQVQKAMENLKPF